MLHILDIVNTVTVTEEDVCVDHSWQMMVVCVHVEAIQAHSTCLTLVMTQNLWKTNMKFCLLSDVKVLCGGTPSTQQGSPLAFDFHHQTPSFCHCHQKCFIYYKHMILLKWKYQRGEQGGGYSVFTGCGQFFVSKNRSECDQNMRI